MLQVGARHPTVAMLQNKKKGVNDIPPMADKLACVHTCICKLCVCKLNEEASVSVSMLGKKETGQTSCQTQAGIGHSTPAHRGGHVQNRSRRRQARRGKIGPGPPGMWA